MKHNIQELPLEQAIALYEKGALQQAQTAFELLRHNAPNNEEVLLYLSYIAVGLEEPEKAEPYLVNLLRIHPDKAEYHYLLGASLGLQALKSGTFRQMLLAPRMKASFEEAIRLDKEHTEARKALVDYYLKAPAILGGTPKALEEASSIEKYDKRTGLLVKAKIYNESGEEKKAVECLEQLLLSGSAEAGDYMQLVGYWKREGNLWVKLERFKEQYSSLPQTYYLVALASLDTESHTEEGIQAINQYISKVGKQEKEIYADAYCKLGKLYIQRRQKNEAFDAFEKALEYCPDSVEANEEISKLKRD
ncbi:tetratricopeptide repeat protein [Limibacter armeniacum]|uniref:tetratricopeptide repeat protein n=1 Tax=Limibacter armeniacum TaxID=466084 RepID=UPI002FE542B7